MSSVQLSHIAALIVLSLSNEAQISEYDLMNPTNVQSDLI